MTTKWSDLISSVEQVLAWHVNKIGILATRYKLSIWIGKAFNLVSTVNVLILTWIIALYWTLVLVWLCLIEK